MERRGNLCKWEKEKSTQKSSCPNGQELFFGFAYNFPHCLPVKKRRVVVARNTLPARSTVLGNSG